MCRVQVQLLPADLMALGAALTQTAVRDALQVLLAELSRADSISLAADSKAQAAEQDMLAIVAAARALVQQHPSKQVGATTLSL